MREDVTEEEETGQIRCVFICDQRGLLLPSFRLNVKLFYFM